MCEDATLSRDILCTLGPASCSEQILSKMMQAGMSMVRINSAHGDYQENEQIVDCLERISLKNQKIIPVILDIKGFDIRLENFFGEYEIQEGQSFFLVNPDKADPKKYRFPFIHIDLLNRLSKGNIIRIDSGCLTATVFDVNFEGAELIAQNRWKICPSKGVSLPYDVSIDNDSLILSDKDISSLQLCLTRSITWIALSFVRSPRQVEELRKWLSERNFPPIKIMAKLETELPLKTIESIIQISDGIMIARGDLGATMPIEKLPALQKTIVNLSLKHCVPCIVATQMLSSMVHQPLPCRSEVTDVFNAILDGATGTMLSEETAIGNFVVETVKMMRKLHSAALHFIQEKKA